MTVFKVLELRRIKDGKYHEHMLNDGTSLRSKIESISIKIRDKIEACGNAVDCYYKESSLSMFAFYLYTHVLTSR